MVVIHNLAHVQGVMDYDCKDMPWTNTLPTQPMKRLVVSLTSKWKCWQCHFLLAWVQTFETQTHSTELNSWLLPVWHCDMRQQFLGWKSDDHIRAVWGTNQSAPRPGLTPLSSWHRCLCCTVCVAWRCHRRCSKSRFVDVFSISPDVCFYFAPLLKPRQNQFAGLMATHQCQLKITFDSGLVRENQIPLPVEIG